MFFETKILDKNYSIDVNETKNQWKIGIKDSTIGKWVFYNIAKSDFQTIDNAVSFLFQGSSYLVDVFGGGNEYSIFTRGSYRTVKIYNDESLLQESLTSSGGFGHGDQLTAGMPGKVIKIFVKPGDEIKANDPLMIMEAMKMENEMRASHNEKIKDVLVKPGESIEAGAVLITFER